MEDAIMEVKFINTKNLSASLHTESEKNEQTFFYNKSLNKIIVSPMNTLNGQLFENPNDISDGIFFVKDFATDKFVRASFNPFYAPLQVYNSDGSKVFCPFHNAWETNFKSCSILSENSSVLKIKISDNNFSYGFKLSVHPQSNNFIELSYICFNPLEKSKMAFTVKRVFGNLDKNLYDGFINSKNKISAHCPKDLFTELPTEIVEIIVRIIETDGKNKFGIKLNYENLPVDENLISALLAYPFEPRLFYLTDTVKEIKSINSSNPNCFNQLCDLLQIKPWKTFRRLFHKNYSVLPVLVSLNKIGFKDINIINDILSDTQVLNLLYKNKNPYDFDSLCFFVPDFDDQLNLLEKFFCDELKQKSERSVLNMIKKNIKSYDEKKISDMLDAVNMFYINENYLSDKEREKIFKEGLSQYNHNLLANIQNEIFQELSSKGKNGPNKKFTYSADEKKFEAEIEGYKFLLPEDSTMLHEIGSELSNCVGLYIKKIQSKTSLIIYATCNGKIKMCIELKGNKIIQCSSRNNLQPEGNDLKVLNVWAKMKKLIIEENASN